MRFTSYLSANVLQGIGNSSDVALSGIAFGTSNVGTATRERSNDFTSGDDLRPNAAGWRN